MKRKNVNARRKAKRSGGALKKEIMMRNDNLCSHCGGMIKHDFDWSSCVMCGRLADHSCDNCGAYLVAA